MWKREVCGTQNKIDVTREVTYAFPIVT